MDWPFIMGGAYAVGAAALSFNVCVQTQPRLAGGCCYPPLGGGGTASAVGGDSCREWTSYFR